MDAAHESVVHAAETKAAALETPAALELSETPPPVAGVEAAPTGEKKKKKKKKGDKAEKSAKASEKPSDAIDLAPKAPEPADPAPAPRMPVLVAAHAKADEEIDLSISHKFFTDGDSMPPPAVEPHELEHEEKPVPLTKETIAHRNRLKQIVGGVVAFCALFGLIAVGKVILGSKAADAMPSNDAVAAARPPETKKTDPAPTAKDEPKPTAAAAAAPKDEPKPADSAASADDKKADDKKADDKKDADKKDDADRKDAEADKKGDSNLSDADIKALKTKATIAANGGDMKKAIDAANAAIAADPHDAMMYMYLYNSYLNLGKMKEATEALNECVRTATTADRFQCAQWGGHK